MRPPVDTIAAPLLPVRGAWLNLPEEGAIAIQRARPMLVEFWDFCRPNSVRTLPYLRGWHERYAGAGLSVIGVHCPGFEISRPREAVADAVERLRVPYPVLVDSEFEVWREYENQGWPARYLFDEQARLFEYHYGEGSYEETELAIQELTGERREPLAPLRPEDAPGARLAPQTADQPGAYSGPYEAGGVWAVLGGAGEVLVNGGAPGGRELAVTHPGAYELIAHERHTAATLELRVGDGVDCLATCFTPGLSPLSF